MAISWVLFVFGLAIFLTGIYLISKEIDLLAKRDVKKRLSKWTNNTWLTLGAGFVVTAILQSSSLVSSLAVVLAGTKTISVRAGILIFLGANVGTTVLDQFIASPALDWGFYILLFGGIIYLLGRAVPSIRLSGLVIFTIGIIFIGIRLMSSAFAIEGDLLSHTYLIQFVNQPWLMFGFGIVMTVLMQSSSASTGIVLAAVLAGLVPSVAAIPFFLGADIGTTITENLASLVTGRPGKVVARGSFLFSLIVGLVVMTMLGGFVDLIETITPDITNPARLVANAHILLNLAAALLVLPFLGHLENLASFITPTPKLKPSDK